MEDEIVLLNGDHGRYSFLPNKPSSILGEGGSGVVHKGICIANEQNEKIRKPVAIKKLFIESTDDATNISRIKRAAEIRIKHPGLLQILDFIEHEEKLYVVSEFLEGQTLDKIIDDNNSKSKKMPLEQVVDLSRQLIAALTALHQHTPQIIHRDIKPENIMVKSDGRIKLLDYGIAKVADAMNKVTVDGSMMGTPAYLPLEQIRGLVNQISPATDFYSVGILIYQLITGELPFKGSYFEIIHAHEEDELPYHSAIPDSFYKVIKKATDKNPLNRYYKGNKFSMALDVALTQKGEKTSKPLKLPLKKIGVFSLVALLALFAVIFGNKVLNGKGDSSDPTSQSDKGRKSVNITTLFSNIESRISSGEYEAAKEKIEELKRIDSKLGDKEAEKIKELEQKINTAQGLINKFSEIESHISKGEYEEAKEKIEAAKKIDSETGNKETIKIKALEQKFNTAQSQNNTGQNQNNILSEIERHISKGEYQTAKTKVEKAKGVDQKSGGLKTTEISALEHKINTGQSQIKTISVSEEKAKSYENSGDLTLALDVYKDLKNKNLIDKEVEARVNKRIAELERKANNKDADIQNQFDALVAKARASKLRMDDCMTTLQFYSDALGIKSDKIIDEEKNELFIKCTDNYNVSFGKGEREFNLRVDYEKAMNNLVESVPNAVTESKKRAALDLIEKTKKLHYDELIERGDMKMKYSKYEDAINHYSDALKYFYSPELDNKIKECKSKL